MKKIRYTALAFALVTAGMFSSCKKAKVDINFNLDVANISFVIDTTSHTGNIEFAATTFQSELQKKLEDNKASADDVQSIKLTGARFIMINPGSQNFDIVEKANAYLSASGLAETKIAYNDAVPDGVTEVSLNTSSGDLKEYLKQSVVNFKADGFTSAPNLERDSIKVQLTFRVDASVSPL